MDKYSDFSIITYRNHVVLVNTKGGRDKHTHLKHKNTAKFLIDLVCNKVVPKSSYLRSSAKRVSRDNKYIEKINIKENKDKQKPKYVNNNPIMR